MFAYSDELDSWLKNRSKGFERQPAEPRNPESVPFREPRHSPATYQDPESSRSSSTQGQRNGRPSELMAVATKMWETVSPSSLGNLARLYRDVIDLDPENAEAFAGLSRTMISAGVLGNLRSSVAYDSARFSLERALEIDPELASARCSVAWLLMLSDRDWQGARKILEELLDDRHFIFQAVVGRVLFHIAEGCPAVAAELLNQLSQTHVLNAGVVALRCWSEYLAGRFKMALALVNQARTSGQAGCVLDAVEALASLQVEELEASIDRMETLVEFSPHNYELKGVLGYAYAGAGQDDKAQNILDILAQPEVREIHNHAYPIALTLIGRHQEQAAVPWLEQSYREGSLWSLGFQSDPILDTLRNNPSYQLLMSRVKYPVQKPSVEAVTPHDEGKRAYSA